MSKKQWVILLGSVVVITVAVMSISFNIASRNKVKNIPYNKLEFKGGITPPLITKFPADFEKQQAIWMQWPSSVYNKPSRPVIPEMINIIKTLDNYVRVNLMTTGTDEITAIKGLLKQSGYTGTNLHYYIINHLSIWARDVGPIFVKDSQNRVKVVDFGFNNYSRDGSKFYTNTEGQVDKLVAEIFKLPVISTKLVSEGGAIESNGKGTLMVPESVALKRNPGMTKQQIENEYKRVLGLKKVIWLKKGLVEDDATTSGHINEFARFADSNTILLAQVVPGDRNTNAVSKESYRRLEENYNILKNSTDQEGKPFRIIRIPIPPTLYSEPDNTGKIPVRSYLNYTVANGVVLIPYYAKTGRSSAVKTTEQQVTGIFQSVFPGRKIIGIDAENINKWGGGIHCITQNMPAY